MIGCLRHILAEQEQTLMYYYVTQIKRRLVADPGSRDHPPIFVQDNAFVNHQISKIAGGIPPDHVEPPCPPFIKVLNRPWLLVAGVYLSTLLLVTAISNILTKTWHVKATIS